jgi:hypothetical protein
MTQTECERLGWPVPEAPRGWNRTDVRTDGAVYSCLPRKLAVILSVGLEGDGQRWLHLSLSHKYRLPTWGELRTVKELFLGPHTYAVQVIPPVTHYVNIHPNVLHLFHCLDEYRLPEFSRGLGTI